MIPVHMEPKGLDRSAIPLSTGEFDAHIRNAINGSALLCDAILRAKGLPSPILPKKIKSERARYSPEMCGHCGTPTKIIVGLVSHIQAAVCAYYGIHINAMTTARKSKSLCHPRQIAMYLASELTPKSLPDIGRRFGGRDHTTVMHAIKAVKARALKDPEVALDVAILRERLAG